MRDLNSVITLLPQHPPMRFIESVASYTSESIACTATTRVLAGEAAFPTSYLIEYMAQACACYLLLKRNEPDNPVQSRSGVIALVKKFSSQLSILPVDETVSLTATPLALTPGYFVFSVSTLYEGLKIASAELAIASHD